jgi:hypothetical protein
MGKLKLNELSDLIIPPNETDDFQFSAQTIPQYENHRLAKDKNDNLLLLIASTNVHKTKILGDYQLENLKINLEVNCNIKQDNILVEKEFCIICYSGNDNSLRKYFLQLCELLLEELGQLPTIQEVKRTIQNFIALFRFALQPSKKTVQGLWSELFLILHSTTPSVLMNCWHSFPEEKYDFNNGIDRIEVKSSSKDSRNHRFSLEQLNPPENCNLIIASIFVVQSANGQSINVLQKEIENRLNGDLELINKLRLQIADTLGDSIIKGVEIKFDYEIAYESLKYYNFIDVPKIELTNIPNNVSDVNFASDLTNLNAIIPSLVFNLSNLYKSL